MSECCQWEKDSDGPGDWWHSGCGHWYHGEYHPETPRSDPWSEPFKFCPYCAKPIKFPDHQA